SFTTSFSISPHHLLSSLHIYPSFTPSPPSSPYTQLACSPTPSVSPSASSSPPPSLSILFPGPSRSPYLLSLSLPEAPSNMCPANILTHALPGILACKSP
ncbi:hypothetical protein TorRG33x02_195250, partial [Trema orientale]